MCGSSSKMRDPGAASGVIVAPVEIPRTSVPKSEAFANLFPGATSGSGESVGALALAEADGGGAASGTAIVAALETGRGAGAGGLDAHATPIALAPTKK